MTLAEEIDALLQQAVNTSRTMHRLEGGEASPGATEREMIELLISMSNAMSNARRTGRRTSCRDRRSAATMIPRR